MWMNENSHHFQTMFEQTNVLRFTIYNLSRIGTSWRCILLGYPENYNYRVLCSLLIVNLEAERINKINLFHGNVWRNFMMLTYVQPIMCNVSQEISMDKK